MKAKIAFIIRCDAQLKQYGFERYRVRTSRGMLDRVYLAEIDGVSVAVIYGRHETKRVPSNEIDFMKAQEALQRLGVQIVVGSFITGSIASTARRGELYMPDDLVAVGGGYHQSMYLTERFRNLDPFQLFCPEVRRVLGDSAKSGGIPLRNSGTYACFHNFPRFETPAELKTYESLGYDIVGQTLDPEVTLARECAMCYAALCVTIDDVEVRNRRIAGKAAESEHDIRACVDTGREQMAKIMFGALPSLKSLLRDSPCDCRRDYHHKGPDYLMRPAPTEDIPFGERFDGRWDLDVRKFHRSEKESVEESLSRELRVRTSLVELAGYLGRNQLFLDEKLGVICKVFHHEGELRSNRERCFAAAADQLPFKIPRLRAFGVLADGSPWIATERLPGSIREHANLAIPVQRRLFGEFGRNLGLLHATSVETVPGLDVRSRAAKYRRSRRRIINSARTKSKRVCEVVESFDELETRVQGCAGPVVKALVHGDYSTRNLLLTGQGNSLTLSGTVDFELSGVADPMEDLAKFALKEFGRAPELREAFLAGYHSSNEALSVQCQDQELRFRYHFLGVVLEILDWAFEDDPEFYQSNHFHS